MLALLHVGVGPAGASTGLTRTLVSAELVSFVTVQVTVARVLLLRATAPRFRYSTFTGAMKVVVTVVAAPQDAVPSVDPTTVMGLVDRSAAGGLLFGAFRLRT